MYLDISQHCFRRSEKVVKNSRDHQLECWGWQRATLSRHVASARHVQRSPDTPCHVRLVIRFEPKKARRPPRGYGAPGRLGTMRRARYFANARVTRTRHVSRALRAAAAAAAAIALQIDPLKGAAIDVNRAPRQLLKYGGARLIYDGRGGPAALFRVYAATRSPSTATARTNRYTRAPL